LNGRAVLGLDHRGCSTANFSNPVRVVDVNTAEAVTGIFGGLTLELRVSRANQGRELPEPLQQSVERYEGAAEG
jgi:hypothetical protein